MSGSCAVAGLVHDLIRDSAPGPLEVGALIGDEAAVRRVAEAVPATTPPALGLAPVAGADGAGRGACAGH